MDGRGTPKQSEYIQAVGGSAQASPKVELPVELLVERLSDMASGFEWPYMRCVSIRIEPFAVVVNKFDSIGWTEIKGWIGRLKV